MFGFTQPLNRPSHFFRVGDWAGPEIASSSLIDRGKEAVRTRYLFLHLDERTNELPIASTFLVLGEQPIYLFASLSSPRGGRGAQVHCALHYQPAPLPLSLPPLPTFAHPGLSLEKWM